MSFRNKLFQFVYRQMIDRPTRNKSFADQIRVLDKSGKALLNRVASKPDTPENRDQLRHIIGIERWGQRRLQSLLGQPFTLDEYDSYRPDGGDMRELHEAFAQTRATSISLAQELEQRGIAKTTTVRHNDAGDVSVGGWLNYFVKHANFESRRIK